MQITTDKDELRRALAEKQRSHVRCRSFRTGLEALDEIAPNGAFQGGAVHELLWPRQSTYPKSLALLLARQRRKTVARLLGVIQSASVTYPLCQPQESTLRIWSSCAAQIARISFGRWPSACAVAGSARPLRSFNI